MQKHGMLSASQPACLSVCPSDCRSVRPSAGPSIVKSTVMCEILVRTGCSGNCFGMLVTAYDSRTSQPTSGHVHEQLTIKQLVGCDCELRVTWLDGPSVRLGSGPTMSGRKDTLCLLEVAGQVLIRWMCLSKFDNTHGGRPKLRNLHTRLTSQPSGK